MIHGDLRYWCIVSTWSIIRDSRGLGLGQMPILIHDGQIVISFFPLQLLLQLQDSNRRFSLPLTNVSNPALAKKGSSYLVGLRALRPMGYSDREHELWFVVDWVHPGKSLYLVRGVVCLVLIINGNYQIIMKSQRHLFCLYQYILHT